MSSYKVMKTPGDTAWFMKDRFGMFIHFGIYALPARHEWVKNYEKVPEEKYDKYFELFNPDLLDADEWARQAKNAGMKYAVLTAKHHDGFCLWDSKYTDYKVTNTPYGKDIVKQYTEAFRKAGLKVGLYYSLLDWHHEEFPIDWMHPRCDDEDAEEINKSRDMKKYAQYMRDQVSELLTNYGDIDILWFDFSYNHLTPEGTKPYLWGKGKNEWESEKLIELVRSIRPNIIINNRCDLDQDIWTPEQYSGSEWPTHKITGELLPWEVCQTFSGSWGYYRDETTWKSPEQLINMLINTVSVGGNVIMNVGPTGRGYFDHRATEALEAFGEWMRYNSRSIYNCTMAEPEFKAPAGCKLTQSIDRKRLYVHLIDYPIAYLVMPGMAGRIEYAQFVHDDSELLFIDGDTSTKNVGTTTPKGKDLLIVKLPIKKPNIITPVVELILK